MERSQLASADGTRLAAYRWSPDGPHKADILLIHGAFEHLGRYEHVASALVAAGYRVSGVDLRGHGHSNGKRGHVSRWNEYVEDVRAVVTTLDTPYFAVGHSMGGNIALDHLRGARNVRGMALTAPMLGVVVQAPAWKVAAGRLLSRVLPSLHMGNELDGAMVCSDPAVAEAYANDPLVFGTITPRWYTEMLKAIDRVLDHAPKYTTPLWVGHGSIDKLVSIAAIEAFAGRYGGEVSLRSYDGLYHEILNEPSRDAILAEMVAWLDGLLDG